MTNYAVVGLGFGDESKGATVDHLCRTRDVGLVVRFNGGGQAGHNVVTDGRHHTFSQWGSGTLAGVPTFLSRFMVVDPLALVPEAEHLESIGVEDPWSMLTIDPRSLVVTPWHRAAQRFEEKLRGDKRHGTCGMGIGKAVEESIKRPSAALRWGDIVASGGSEAERALAAFEAGVEYVSPLAKYCRRRFGDHPLASMEHSDGEYPWARQPDEVAKEFARIAKLPRTLGWRLAVDGGPVVFEGAQGVLLDEDYGFHPHTTWSTTTFANADSLAAEAGLDKPYRLGVTRAYSYRHGPGPFPTEEKGWVPGPRSSDSLHPPEPHNGHDEWRGGCRYGPLDLVLLKYAVEVCRGVDGIAVSHLDQLHEYAVDRWITPLGMVERLPVPKQPSLARQEAIGGILAHTRLAGFMGMTIPTAIEHTLGVPVVIESHGPTALDRNEKAGVPA